VIAAISMVAAAGAIAAPSLEYAVKAAYLAKFAPFVEWPDKAFPLADSAINVCVSGADPFGTAVAQVAAGQHVDGRPMALRRVGPIGPGSGCQIVFLGGSPEQSVAQGLAALHGEPVLSVTDEASGEHGIINFVIVDGRVRFEVDKNLAEENHIVISSKLLSLAVVPK